MTYIVNQFRSAQFPKFIVIIPLALLRVKTACSAIYSFPIICLALLLLTSLTDATLSEKMTIYENTAPNLHVKHFDFKSDDVFSQQSSTLQNSPR